ncbi:hypothetical protein [Salinisphaera japonica]|uniref:hypothetical protein n=1 Tax=Salinisphaera japonica TaxID=1304270 RepID=UPI000F4D0000|nr:hypothetical protein [Salinisphaera japonica]|tara:strand:+ start:5138 stop:6712 length:1575 start_codon:yes stop_codon:yes gene_type:complete
MSGDRPHRNDTLDSYLKQAAHDLAQSNKALGDDAEGLLFLGVWHQSYPAILVRDPFLSDSAKVQFLLLMQESSQKPHDAIAMPSLTHTAQVLGHGRRTVHRDRTLLRICRWISQHKRVRDRRGRYCGSINAIHSEPCALADANRLDATYLQLLDRSKGDDDPYIRNAALAALASIDQALNAGHDPLEPPDPMNRRIEAAKAVQSGGGTFFDLLMPEGGRIAKQHDPNSAGHTVATSPRTPKSALGQPEPTHPSANFVDKSARHTVATPSAGANSAPGYPSVNSAPGASQPSADFALGSQVVENKNDRLNYPQNTKFALGPTCSSNTTTTNKNEPESARASRSSSRAIDSGKSSPPNSATQAADALRWPEALPANERTLIERSFASMQLTGTQCQEVLDALARKLQDPDNPMRSPVGYAVALCKRVRSGTFQPVGAPPRPSGTGGSGDDSGPRGPRGELTELRRQIHNLQSEIKGFDDNLIPFAHPESQPHLEAQRDRLCQERDALKQRYQALRGEDGASCRKQA